MDLTALVQICIGVVLVPMAASLIALLISFGRIKQVVYGNGIRGIAGDVESNRRHIDNIEKKCLVAHGDGSSGNGSADSERLTKILGHAVKVWERETKPKPDQQAGK